MNDRLKTAINILKEQQKSCVILNINGEIRTSEAIGIKPLMEELRINKQAFTECVIADKVIGKAAALMAYLGNAEAVYGTIMSENAEEFLMNVGLEYEYGELVPYIENRTKDGRCPMEETVLEINDPNEAFEALENTIAKLMAQKAEQ